MTVAVESTDLGALLLQVDELLAAHPAGKQVCLLLKPQALELPEGHALVQVATAEHIVLVPRPIDALDPWKDMLHDTQVLPLGDKETGLSTSFVGPYCVSVAVGAADPKHTMRVNGDEA